MDNKVKSLNTLLSAFESRNELLEEEIKKNEEAIKEMKEELTLLMDDDVAITEVNDEFVEMA